MSTHTDGVECPNCHVSDQTDVATRMLTRDADGDADYVYCKLCHYLGLAPESTDRYYESREYAGDVVPIEDVPLRARALMTEDGWTDEDIDENVESWVDPEWLERPNLDEGKVLESGGAATV